MIESLGEMQARVGISLRARVERKGKLLAHRLAGGVFSKLLADLIEEKATRQIPVLDEELRHHLAELEQATKNKEESRAAQLRAVIRKIRQELEILRDRDYFPDKEGE